MDDQLRNTLITGLFTLVACFLTYKASTRATSVTQQNTDAARTKQLREDLTVAEEEVRKLRREVTVLTREAEAAVADLVYLRRTIWRDGMTIDRLREFVGRESEPPPSPNGR